MAVKRGRALGVAIAVATTPAILAALVATAPYLAAEFVLRRHGALVEPAPLLPVVGRWVDDYYVVEAIDPTTFAIGEPRYYQGNYSYLILGTERAVLFDAGSGNRDLVPIVRSLTALPVTVTASHLHFDHVGALGHFDRTALLDVGRLRVRARHGIAEPGRYEFLGFADGRSSPRVRVDDWWQNGMTLDLGHRRLTVLHTPGHTPTSMSLYDADRRLLFCGDLVYPGTLYAFLPGASRQDYRRTVEQLLATLGADTTLLTAHMADAPTAIAAPRLKVADLRALQATLEAIASGTVPSTGLYPRVYAVNDAMHFATGYAVNNR